MPTCRECGYLSDGILGIQIHLRRVHKYDEHTAIYKCGEPTCFKTYPQWSKYRTHLKSFHKFVNNGTGKSDSPVNITFVTASQEEGNGLDLPSEVNDTSLFSSNKNRAESTSCGNNVKDVIESEAARLVGKLYSKPGYPRKLVQDYIEDTSCFMYDVVHEVEKAVRQELLDNDVDISVVESVCANFSAIKNPFSGLDTEHKRFEYLLKQGYYIPPIAYNIGADMVSKISGGKVIFEIGNAKGVFIPLRKTLKAFMELPNVLRIALDFLRSPPPSDILSEFIHGSHWISKRQLFHYDIVIPYSFFFDEYEVDKELGAHSAKLGAVYLKLACFPPEFQGEVDNVFLALLFNHADRKDYSTKNVFRKLIEELNFLQNEGISVNVEDKSYKIHFVIGLAIGDNLGIHTILCLVECFSATMCCRFCYVTKENLHVMTVEDPSLLRNKTTYTRDIEERCVRQTGVNGPSVMSEIEHFHPTENPFVDMMHDIDEGVAVYDIQHILFHLIFVKEYFDVNILNVALVTFNYSPDLTNRPNQLSENRIRNRSINMTAAEMRTFVRILSLLVGDLVPEDEPMWKLYLSLREIYDIVLCSCLQKEMATILKLKIAEHHRLYLQITGDTLKPKHHFLVHYPRILLKSGSFVKNSCHRLEAKHQPSIQDARATKSRKFIALTIALKEQLRFANRLQSKRGLNPKFEVGSERATGAVFSRVALPLSFQQQSMQYSFVNVKGTVYKKDVCVVMDADDDDGPRFGIVTDVFVNTAEKEAGLVCDVLSTVSFCDHFHAYQVVNKKSIKKFVLVSELFDHHPLWYNQCNNGLAYVTLHHLL